MTTHVGLGVDVNATLLCENSPVISSNVSKERRLRIEPIIFVLLMIVHCVKIRNLRQDPVWLIT